MKNKKTPYITLTGSYQLCTAHKLENKKWSAAKNRQVFGKCYGMHGHEYRVEIILAGYIDADSGMLINGFDVDEIVQEKVVSKLDHKYLNKDVPFFKKYPSTAEWIAYWIYHELETSWPKHCVMKLVRVYETGNLWAEYAGEVPA